MFEEAERRRVKRPCKYATIISRGPCLRSTIVECALEDGPERVTLNFCLNICTKREEDHGSS